MCIQYSCALKAEQREGGAGIVGSNSCASLFIQYSRLVLFKQSRGEEAEVSGTVLVDRKVVCIGPD